VGVRGSGDTQTKRSGWFVRENTIRTSFKRYNPLPNTRRVCAFPPEGHTSSFSLIVAGQVQNLVAVGKTCTAGV
jgi:hypothetical protein